MLFGMMNDVHAAVVPLAIIGLLKTIWPYLLLAIGFSLVIFVHELGHFLAAKWAGVRVERFAIGFGKELVGFTRGETRYSLNFLPLGGYVKMLGQEDFVVDKSGELKVKDDPTSFTNKSVGKRMVIVTAGVVMNLIFAAVALTIVAMVGKYEAPAVVGDVLPDSPAGNAGLQTGDRIVAINGKPVETFLGIKAKVTLSDTDEVLVLDVIRDGKPVIPKPEIKPEFKEAAKERQLGFAQGMGLRVMRSSLFLNDEPSEDELHDNDKFALVIVDGKDVACKGLGQLQRAVNNARGGPVEVIVRRPKDPKSLTLEQQLGADADVASVEQRVRVRAKWSATPSIPGDRSTNSLLGLVPRLTVLLVTPEKSLDKAGVKMGDVVRKAGSQLHPTFGQYKAIIEENDDNNVKLEVCRPGESASGLSAHIVRFCILHRETLISAARSDTDAAIKLAGQLLDKSTVPPADRETLLGKLRSRDDAAGWRTWLEDVDVHEVTIVPKSPFTLIRSTPAPTLDAELVPIDEAHLVVADVLDRIGDSTSPAKASGIPAGAVILSAGGQPVSAWFELCEVFRKNAGKQVPLTYRVGDEIENTMLLVPNSVAASLDFPVGTRILKIGDESSITIKTDDEASKKVTLPDWRAVAGLLRASIDKTVNIDFVTPEGRRATGQYHVTPDGVDPWLHRVYFLPGFACYPLMEKNPVHNPITAAGVGFSRAYEWTMVTVLTIKHLIFTRQVSTEKIAGPVGIIHMGGQLAEAGIPSLLWFLGIISANLAVINFLPLPIVDGGLFVFLLLEKIRGEPVSIKTQVATQLVGIALIATLFILVTYQDILRLIGV